jgi:hypothetical protein
VPLRRCGAMARPVCKTHAMSGSRFLLSGVGNAKDDGFRLLDTGKIRRGLEAACPNFLCDGRRSYVPNVASLLIESVHLFRIDQGRVPGH